MGEKVALLEQSIAALSAERDQYRKLYLSMLELCRRLERGILAQKRERFVDSDASVTMSLLGLMMGNTEEAAPPSTPPKREEVKGHTRAKPRGRKPLPENLPRVDIEVLPPEVQAKGTDAFDRIGEEVTETVERRLSSFIVVRTHKPKFVLKGTDRLGECEVLQGEALELPIPRGLAGPGLLADTIVRRWQDHLPLYRLERIYGREGLPLARSTICGWHAQLSALVQPLTEAMWKDAFTAPYLCTDATGVLVQDNERCRHGHFWVVAAPEKHILFGYTPKHNGAAVDTLLAGYKGYLVADAHSVYEHLFQTGDIIECGCMSHSRRYFHKALLTDPERARHALTLQGALFELEKKFAALPPEERRLARLAKAKPILDEFFAWCDREANFVLDHTPISSAIGYARNQRVALMRYLEDGRLPMHNNLSERELKREGLGRNAWLFIGNDEAGDVNTTFVTLLASCQLHRLEPLGYIRDLLCLLPGWPASRVLELAPAYWEKTLQQLDTQQRLAANVFRQVSLGALVEHRPTK